MKVIFFSLLFGLAVITAKAIEDTPQNRSAEADRYLLANPPDELLVRMTDVWRKNLSPEQQEIFVTSLKSHTDTGKLSSSMKAHLVADFTAEELKALADFYSSPGGKSAMKKWNGYMDVIMPLLNEAVTPAVAEAQRAASKKAAQPSPTPSPATPAKTKP